jgi:hypothetical protein
VSGLNQFTWDPNSEKKRTARQQTFITKNGVRPFENDFCTQNRKIFNQANISKKYSITIGKMGVTSGAGIAYPSRAPEFNLSF